MSVLLAGAVISYQQQLLLLQGCIHEGTVVSVFLECVLGFGQSFCLGLYYLQVKRGPSATNSQQVQLPCTQCTDIWE